jgi:formamidopyrimidine-DNA glycosylase
VPELPEVEVLVRHLKPALADKRVRRIEVRRPRVIRPTTVRRLSRRILGACFDDVSRRGKYLLFGLRHKNHPGRILVVGHLGMTGRMYVLPARAPLPKHAAVVIKLNAGNFVFEDTRYFGRFTLDERALDELGPEPLSLEFTSEGLARNLKRSSQAVKVKLLDQRMVAGVGNIYASEALFEARIAPTRPARSLTRRQVARLWEAIRAVLRRAIEAGSTVPLNFSGVGGSDRLFYFGRDEGASGSFVERLQVYDRAGLPCVVCGTAIKRCVQAGRSTFFCPSCQRG